MHDSVENRIIHLLNREFDTKIQSSFRESNVYTYDLINRLHLDSELKDHDGCVNCIEWNQEGNMLASGSDDLKIKLWNPFKQKLLTTIDSKHRGNIFSVKYIPFTNDNIIASSAADSVIYVHDVNNKSTIQDIRTHKNRVKRLEVAKDTPNLFWSSGEDGCVLQHDIRCSGNDVSKLLINYSSCDYRLNKDIEVKCLAINPIRTEYIAVGCNDPFARVYDRRMIDIQQLNNNSNTSRNTSKNKCVHEYCPDEYNNKIIRYYSPGHLPTRLNEYKKRLKYLSITYLTYNQHGNELLVNLSGEQVYLFDVNNSSKIKYNSYQTLLSDLKVENEGENEDKKKKKYKLPDKVEEIKNKANKFFENEKYNDAIFYYNKAISLVPNSPILYGNRAAALMKRNWDGDIYAAMKDCYLALNIDKEHMKSHFRLARCLHELKWHKEARECIQQFCKIYKSYSNTNVCESLIDEIENAIKKSTTNKTNTSKRVNANDDESSSSSSDEQKSKTFKDKNGDKSSKPESLDSDDGNDENKKKFKINCEKYENYLKLNAIDYSSYFVGHCNVATDIKETNFIGDKFIGAGSDDGSLFIWDRKTTNILKIFKADDSIVNCVQPNPYTCMIATSGIDPHIRIWTPGLEPESRIVDDINTACEKNNKQMNQNPIEYFFMNINSSLDEDTTAQNVGCRTS